MRIPLAGHTTPETAYVVDDYPYGFRLRCRIRYWLEYKPGKGFRLWSQTTNPKAGNGWTNKPKSSTFCRFGGVMLRDEDNGHITWEGVHEYMDVAQCVAFREAYGHTMPEAAQVFLESWITRKLFYEQAKAEGAVKCTMTVTQYGCITSPDFGKPIAPTEVTETILTPDYTPEQLASMGRTLRADASSEISKLQ